MGKIKKTKQEKREEIIRYVVTYGTIGLIYCNRLELTNLFNTGVFAIRSLDPSVGKMLNDIKDGIVIYLNAFNLMFTLRFLLMWFPTINPFIQPYYIVRVVTEPPIEWVRKRVPFLFGMDFSFLIVSYAINYSIKYLAMFKF